MDSHHDNPLNRRACCFDISGEWFLRAVSRRGLPLIGRCSAIELRRMGNGRAPGAAPGVSSSSVATPRLKMVVVPVTLRRRLAAVLQTAHGMVAGRWSRTTSEAYEAPFPLGFPAVRWKMARRPGAAPDSGVLEAPLRRLAPAALI